MNLAIYLVDAFADRPLAGNPAAVCPLPGPGWPTEAWMQSIAGEMNQSETAFILPPDEQGHRPLRWFTPAAEVELCGHATLASAHVLWQEASPPHRAPADAPLIFQTQKRGRLTCRPTADGQIAMDFPLEAVTPAEELPARIAAHLGVADDIEAVSRTPYDWLIQLRSAEAVRRASPDFAGLAEHDVRGFILTAISDHDDGVDFVSRFFAPRLRIAEDPVTGSIHCALGPYWADRLGRFELQAEQASARGGKLGVRVRGERVELIGRAFTTLRGALTADLAKARND